MPRLSKAPAYKRVALTENQLRGFCHEGGIGSEATELENIARQCVYVAQNGRCARIVVGG